MLWQAFRLAALSIVRNKLRSFLTILGVVIGVAAVIAMVTVGQGSSKQVIGKDREVIGLAKERGQVGGQRIDERLPLRVVGVPESVAVPNGPAEHGNLMTGALLLGS